MPVDSLVYVAEVRGRRARITKPVEGWMSMHTEDGIEILYPDMTYKGDPDKIDLDQVMQSRQVREANERLQTSGIELTAMEAKLVETLRSLNVDFTDLHDFRESLHRRGHVWLEKSPRITARVGQKLAEEVAGVYKKSVRPGGVDALLERAQKSPHLSKAMHGSKVEEMVGPAWKEASVAGANFRRSRQSLAEFEASMQEIQEEAQADDLQFASEKGPLDM